MASRSKVLEPNVNPELRVLLSYSDIAYVWIYSDTEVRPEMHAVFTSPSLFFLIPCAILASLKGYNCETSVWLGNSRLGL